MLQLTSFWKLSNSYRTYCTLNRSDDIKSLHHNVPSDKLIIYSNSIVPFLRMKLWKRTKEKSGLQPKLCSVGTSRHYVTYLVKTIVASSCRYWWSIIYQYMHTVDSISYINLNKPCRATWDWICVGIDFSSS